MSSAGHLIFGRVTYEGMAYRQTATGEVADYVNRLPKAVFSRTLARADWHKTKLVKSDVAAEISHLKSSGEQNMFVFGSANLCATLIEQNRFGDCRLALAPIVLGAGKTLFPLNAARLNLKLLDSRALSNGCLILRYAPLRSQ